MLPLICATLPRIVARFTYNTLRFGLFDNFFFRLKQKSCGILATFVLQDASERRRRHTHDDKTMGFGIVALCACGVFAIIDQTWWANMFDMTSGWCKAFGCTIDSLMVDEPFRWYTMCDYNCSLMCTMDKIEMGFALKRMHPRWTRER